MLFILTGQKTITRVCEGGFRCCAGSSRVTSRCSTFGFIRNLDYLVCAHRGQISLADLRSTQPGIPGQPGLQGQQGPVVGPPEIDRQFAPVF